jgi:Family of unknown function (DUF5994)
MTATIESIATVRTRRPAIGTLRLRLKPAHQACGFVQGAWWPRSTLLTVELPSLLAALSLRFGRIDRVQYRETDWSQAPQHIKHQGAGIVLDSSQDSPNIISAVRSHFPCHITIPAPAPIQVVSRNVIDALSQTRVIFRTEHFTVGKSIRWLDRPGHCHSRSFCHLTADSTGAAHAPQIGDPSRDFTLPKGDGRHICLTIVCDIDVRPRLHGPDSNRARFVGVQRKQPITPYAE